MYHIDIIEERRNMLQNDDEKRILLSVVEKEEEVTTLINCEFRELFSILVQLTTQLSAMTGGEISYNEILSDLKLIEKEEK